MKTQVLAVAVAALAVGLGGMAAHAATKTYAGHELAQAAHVPLDKAQAIALKARPGKITDKELEKESGGSGLRWSFDITAAGKTYEVGVDARTGKVLENKDEGPHPD